MIGQQATSQRCRHFSVLRGRAGETNIGEVVVRYHAHTADPVLGTAGGSPRLKRLTICPVLDSVTDSVPEKLAIQDAVGQREPNDRALWRKVLRLEDNFMYPFGRGHLSLWFMPPFLRERDRAAPTRASLQQQTIRGWCGGTGGTLPSARM